MLRSGTASGSRRDADRINGTRLSVEVAAIGASEPPDKRGDSPATPQDPEHCRLRWGAAPGRGRRQGAWCSSSLGDRKLQSEFRHVRPCNHNRHTPSVTYFTRDSTPPLTHTLTTRATPRSP